jgi:hypothetical protein
MELNPYVAAVAADLERATALADEQTRETAFRVATTLEPALRLALTQLLSDAAAEITAKSSNALVTVRMDGREPVLQVEDHTTEVTAPTLASEPEDLDGDDPMSRVNERLPEQLKKRAEAQAQRQDQSLNTWIIQAIRHATSTKPTRSSQTVTGWA